MLKISDRLICQLAVKGVNMNDLALYKFLHNKKKIGRKITVYQRDFRAWFKKNNNEGSQICDKTAHRCFDRLERAGLAIVEAKGFGRWDVTLLSTSFFVFGQDVSNQTDLSTPPESTEAIQEKASRLPQLQKQQLQQQQYIEAKKLLNKIGIDYPKKSTWNEILKHGLDKIETTALMLAEKLVKNPLQIKNPCGWFRDALRYNYQKSYKQLSIFEVDDLLPHIPKKYRFTEGQT